MIRSVFAGVTFLLVLLLSCRPDRKEPSSFYYWKSTFQLSPLERQALRNSADSIIYIRFFDVEWDAISQKARPVAPIQWQEALPSYLKVCPVVFIKNEVFEKNNSDSLVALAKHVYQLVQRIGAKTGQSLKTIQVDCDWTLSTRDRYFTFLKALKTESGLRLQATIRLHQIKYRQQTGVPPVEEGVVMYYNMSALNSGKINSIYDRHQARLYLPALKNYPLPLHYALPVFSWAVAHDGQKVTALLNKTNRGQLERDTHFLKTDDNTFKVKQSFFRNGYYLKQGWTLKLEEVTDEDLGEMKTDLEMYAPQPPRHYIYFDLDTLNLQTHEIL
ncbi:MAG: hypothetical protein QM534_09845 [Sediminibacterium sp.]|nr:hypothetical protein [Sediminibacterium sp.]